MRAVRPVGVEGDAVRLRQLKAMLRPEFAADVILVGPDDPVLGGPACAVSDCVLVAVLAGLCGSHHKRWQAAARPALDGWAALHRSTSQGRGPLGACRATGCQRGRKDAGLCQTHLLRWKRAGRPDLESWAAEDSGPALEQRPPCREADCRLHRESSVGLCHSHRSRWNRLGQPDVETFLVDCAVFGLDRFDLRRLPAPLQAEFQYALQLRVDERRTKTRPDQLHHLIVALEASGARTLLERSPEEWLAETGLGSNRHHVARRFPIDAIAAAEDVRDGVGWDAEYPRDHWRLRRLGYDVRDKTMRFDEIEADWLRRLTKRWARWRLSTGVGLDTVMSDVRAVVIFAERCPPLRRGPEALTRNQLERHLAYLAQRYPDAKTRGVHISALAGLVRTARQHGWEPKLPSTAVVYREDYPRRDAPAPRALSEMVMAQLESPTNLARFADAGDRLIAEILMGTGLRVGDAASLDLDCVVRDGDGAPYLRYRNHKMRREAFVPISANLAQGIATRQGLIVATFPAGACLFPRPLRNPDGVLAYSTDTFRRRLDRWLRVCDVRDEMGRPLHITPHQWRHTYGTRLINSEVPQEVVRRLLDHTSHSMTARYARLSDRTIRQRWEAAQKVNVHGEDVAVEGGVLADAAWMKNNLARAKMALPNGYCALPLQQSWEYANACLTCSMFVTTVEFLPHHRRQLDATRDLIGRAEGQGQLRVVEMNRTVEANLLRVIDALEPEADRSGCACHSPTHPAEAGHAG